MKKQGFALKQEQIDELQGAYQQCGDVRTTIRYQAVRLYGSGYSWQEGMKITGYSRTSLLNWCRAYRRYGVAGLVDQRSGRQQRRIERKRVGTLSARSDTENESLAPLVCPAHSASIPRNSTISGL